MTLCVFRAGGYNLDKNLCSNLSQELLLSQLHKKKRLEAAVQAVQQKWGHQALHKGAFPAASSTPSLSTGLPSLDRLLRIGGLPLGHISELIGQPTSGKRTLALHILAQTQPRTPCLYLDLAQTFDPAYAVACHVDLSRLSLAAPASPAAALDLACDLAGGGHFGLVVFDSTAELRIAALPGAAAALRRLRQALAGKPSALLFLTSPAPELSTPYPPGFDLAQAAALRLEVNRQRWLRQRGSVRGYEARVAILRSRWAEPGGQTTVRIILDGICVTEGNSRELRGTCEFP
jgi:recombination protein RecA